MRADDGQIGHGTELRLVVDAQAFVLGQVLPKQPAGVLAGATLPGAGRITKVLHYPALAVRSVWGVISLHWS